MSEWRRADLGDLPPVGDEISMVIYPADTQTVVVYNRMRVEVVMIHPAGTTVAGPTLASTHQVDLPGRPEQIPVRRAIFWMPYEGDLL